MTFRLERQPDTRPDEEFWYVIDTRTGKRVGRIYSQESVLPPGAVNVWYWTLEMPHYRGSDAPYYGNVETKAAAKAAFKERWLLTNRE